jgi:hypothetical protein
MRIIEVLDSWRYNNGIVLHYFSRTYLSHFSDLIASLFRWNFRLIFKHRIEGAARMRACPLIRYEVRRHMTDRQRFAALQLRRQPCHTQWFGSRGAHRDPSRRQSI